VAALGPTSRATSSASMAWSTCRPVPTARPATLRGRRWPTRPRRRSLARAPPAGRGRSWWGAGYPSARRSPFWSSDLAVARHLPQGRSQAGTATSTSTGTGTTSPPVPAASVQDLLLSRWTQPSSDGMWPQDPASLLAQVVILAVIPQATSEPSQTGLTRNVAQPDPARPN
jgi:hypothetical protein